MSSKAGQLKPGIGKRTKLGLALEELAFVTRKLRILGVYRGHPFRARAAKKLSKA